MYNKKYNPLLSIFGLDLFRDKRMPNLSWNRVIKHYSQSHSTMQMQHLFTAQEEKYVKGVCAHFYINCELSQVPLKRRN